MGYTCIFRVDTNNKIPPRFSHAPQDAPTGFFDSSVQSTATRHPPAIRQIINRQSKSETRFKKREKKINV